MAFDNKKNFAKGTLNGAIDDTQTNLNLNAGDGANFPDPPFNVVIWNKGVYEDPSDDPNVEIVRVTNKGSGDDWTITRAQEDTNAHSHPDGSRVDLVPTAKTFTDIESAVPGNYADNETPSGTIDGSNKTFTLANSPSPADSLMLFVNGVFQTSGEDYSLSGDTITFTVAPPSGSIIRAFYRY